MSIGREGVSRELGAMFGQRFALNRVRLGAKDTRMLVAITAAAGLAGVYNAPLAGTFRGGDPARRRDARDGHARVRLLGARLKGEPGQGHAHVLFDRQGEWPIYPRLHGVRADCRPDSLASPARYSAAVPSGRRKQAVRSGHSVDDAACRPADGALWRSPCRR